MGTVLGFIGMQAKLPECSLNIYEHYYASDIKIVIIKFPDNPIRKNKNIIKHFKNNKHAYVYYDGFVTSESITSNLETLYERDGINFLGDLNGRFSLVVCDSKHKKLILASDKMGNKTFYYYRCGDTLVFSSSLKTLAKYLDLRLEQNSFESFLKLGYLPGQSTVFKNVKKVLPGHALIYSNARVSQRSYWQLITEKLRNSPESFYINGLKNNLFNTIEGAKGKRTFIFFTGGIDSSFILSLLKKTAKEVTGICGGFSGFSKSTFIAANKAAKYLSVKNINFEITIKDLLTSLPMVVKLMDELSYAIELPIVYSIIKKLKDHTDIFFSGMGCDEIFEADISSLIKEKNKLLSLDIKHLLPPSNALNDLILMRLKSKIFSALLMHESLTSSLCAPRIIFPYLNAEFVKFILSTPEKLRNLNDIDKYILRMSTQDLLPRNIYLQKRNVTPFPYQWIKTCVFAFKNEIKNNSFLQERLYHAKVYKDYAENNEFIFLLKLIIFMFWQDGLKAE